MGALFSFINEYIIYPLGLDGQEAFLAFLAAVPFLIALLVVWWDIKSAIKGFITWFMLLGIAFLFMTQSLEQTIAWGLIFGMFFSVIGVPVLALIFKLRKKYKHSKQSAPRQI